MALVIGLCGLVVAGLVVAVLIVTTGLSRQDVLTFVRGFPDDFAALLVTALLPLAVVVLIVAAVRRNRPSLIVRAFGDGAVEPKEGTALSALVQGHLLEISRLSSGSRDSYQLDTVETDVELLAEENDLASAVSGVAEVPQLHVAAAAVAFVDSVLPAK
jgi:hypothetical protein